MELKRVSIPDLGNVVGAEVIEVHVQVGDSVSIEDSLITLESDKASMDIPSPYSGIVREVQVVVGETVSKGRIFLSIESDIEEKVREEKELPKELFKELPKEIEKKSSQDLGDNIDSALHTTPAVRRLAREFGVDLAIISGNGRKNRILKEDLQNYVKEQLSQTGNNKMSSGGSVLLPEMPWIDFSQYGDIEEELLPRIKKISAQNLHRNWVVIPHVTQFDEVDITEMESFRTENKGLAEKEGFKLTPIIFLIKAIGKALQEFRLFNSSLSKEGDKLIVKKYYHVGVAVDTPRGLVVPVVRDVNKKGLFDLGRELAQLSHSARALKLMPDEMQGSCFTISSLGGIGGTAFTPIINAPDVAILGVSKAQIKPVYDGNVFVPRLMLPLSLSYDHRVIDGAEAARFITYLGSLLTDIRRLLL